jgi:predicted nucleotidyltransferase
MIQEPSFSRAPIRFLIEAATASDVPAGTALYMFGSSWRGQTAPNDIDVLLVYPDGHLDQAHLLAESVRNAATPYIFDVLVLSSGEERELAFIRTERASRIWSRDAPRGADTARART